MSAVAKMLLGRVPYPDEYEKLDAIQAQQVATELIEAVQESRAFASLPEHLIALRERHSLCKDGVRDNNTIDFQHRLSRQPYEHEYTGISGARAYEIVMQLTKTASETGIFRHLAEHLTKLNLVLRY